MKSFTDFAETGRVWLRGILDDDALSVLDEHSTARRPGERHTPNEAFSRTLGAIGRRLHPILPGAKPVRVVSFNKTGAMNWAVPWHQDRVIALRDRREVAGFSNWSNKAGIWHAEPPLEMFENMLFLRIHLDDQRAENGAMEIALGSHRLGKIVAAEAEKEAGCLPGEFCTARRGDILVLHMLTLHRSRVSRHNAPRRVLRVDYTGCDLPGDLEWCT
jgi:hypothetical protein